LDIVLKFSSHKQLKLKSHDLNFRNEHKTASSSLLFIIIYAVFIIHVHIIMLYLS